MKRAMLLAAVFATAGLTGCDYTGDWLFPSVSETVPGVIDLGTIAPERVTSLDELREKAVYGELGATGTVAIGGASFNFEGTGGSVCVFVDPETVYWSQSVAASGKKDWLSWPDNHFDDGDIDLFGGMSVYYSGSPGETIGTFEVRYADQLGNEIPVLFNECFVDGNDDYPTGGGHAGRGRPEYCTIGNTQKSVSYTVVLEHYSPPRDDSRLGYALSVLEGNCVDLMAAYNPDTNPEGILPETGALVEPECFLSGESIDPSHAHDYRDGGILAVGSANVEQFAWEGSVEFERMYCAAMTETSNEMRDYCNGEYNEVQADGGNCNDGSRRCFCGDIRDTPTGGAF